MIGVVTVTYNSAEVLLGFLQSVFSQTYTEFILIVVDNGSEDGTLSVLKSINDSRLHLIANEDNRGFAEGSNQGIRFALGAMCTSVMLLNNDTEFDSTLFGKLCAGIAEGSTDMTCPKVLYFEEPDRIWAAGGMFQPIFGYRSIHRGEGQRDCGQFDAEETVQFAPGCCLLISMDVFNAIGCLDETYFTYVEDSDFLYRARVAGLTLRYVPSATLLHKVGCLTGGEESDFAVWFGTRNRLFFVFKHFGWVAGVAWSLLLECKLLMSVLSPWRWTKMRIKQRAMLEAISLYLGKRRRVSYSRRVQRRSEDVEFASKRPPA
jgi:GT2 family glycosyltransferase